MRVCSLCGNEDKLSSLLSALLSDNFIDEITYKKWTHTDRSNLETVVITSERFIDEFISTLKKYQVHNFITKQQALAFKESRENLDEGEVVVILDVSLYH